MTKKLLTLTVLLCFAAGFVANAQEVRASLSGTVTDQSGAPFQAQK